MTGLLEPKPLPIAAILVGGKGTRLRSLISDLPKPLAPVAGEPFLFLILRQLAAIGLKKVILMTGYLHEKVLDACGSGEQFGLELIYSREIEPLGTAGALLQAQPYLQNHSDFILMNGDTYLDCDLNSFIQTPLNEKCIGMIGTMQPKETERFGTLDIHPETQFIKAFREKVTSEITKTKKAYVNAGIYRLSPKIFTRIPPQSCCSLEHDIFPQLLKDGFSLQAFLLDGEFIDIGIPETYTAFNHKMTLQKA